MRGSFTKLAYVAVFAAGILIASAFRVFGSGSPTTFNGCLTAGGTLINVSTSGAVTCPPASTPVSWTSGGGSGGLSQIVDLTSSKSFAVPAGVNHLGIEAWGGGGGGSDQLVNPICISSAGGGGGGYLRVIIPVTPGETLSVNVGAAGGPGTAGGSSTVLRGSTVLVSAGGGGGGIAVASGTTPATTGGAGGQVVSPGGIVRPGNAGGSGSFDMMCAFAGPGQIPTSPVGPPGTPIQGSVGLSQSNGSGGGAGAFGFGGVAQGGGAGEVILSW